VKLHDLITIAVLPGDGIGVEVTLAAISVFKLLNIPVKLNFGDIGWSFWKSEGTAIPERTWNLIAMSDTILLGAVTSKPEREAKAELAPEFQQCNLNYVSPIIQLRQELDLFANVRPCFTIQSAASDFNCCVIRENTEGLYAGFDYHPVPEEIQELLAKNPRWQSMAANDMSCALRLQTKTGLSRLFNFAFDYATKHKMTRVTFADKPNVLRKSGNFARELFELVASRYPQIHADILNVDAVALRLIRRAGEFGVIVAENMFGDILSDVGAGIMGGLGFAPSANIGRRGCYFEPVHGSAPNVKSNAANPSAMFLTISMLLDHFGYHKEAKKIIASVAAVVADHRFVTYDLGGSATTKDMSDAIIDYCLRPDKDSNASFFHIEREQALNNLLGDLSITKQLPQLQAFSTSEISDALDACGVEGALLMIKPLSPGQKLIGPAYTINYQPYDAPPDDFQNAADYIDSVPVDSVIVINNNGQVDCSVWGGILTQTAMQKGILGTVVYGAVRDVELIAETNYPLFCVGQTMRSGKNRVYKTSEQCPLIINNVTINPGDIIFADDNGVLVIPIHRVDEVISNAQRIQLTEKNIIQAVNQGATLKQARMDYHYSKPWIGCEVE